MALFDIDAVKDIEEGVEVELVIASFAGILVEQLPVLWIVRDIDVRAG